MRNIRKQVQLIANLSQTILQQRLEPSDQLTAHLKEIRKKIRQMAQTETYEEGVAQMLVTKQNFQIRNKITKLVNEKIQEKGRELWVQIRISAIEKRSCQIYNQQLWQFGIEVRNDIQYKKIQNPAGGIVQLIQCVLKYLQCTSLLPLNKQQKNRYMLDHKVIVSENGSSLANIQFQNIYSKEIVLVRENGRDLKRVTSKYFYNERKIQQNIKQIIMSRSFETSENSKKNSIDSTEASKRISIFEYYDDELDITVLSSSDFEDEQGEEIELNLQNEQEEFQILMEETVNDDEQFLRNNIELLNELSSLESDYL